MLAPIVPSVPRALRPFSAELPIPAVRLLLREAGEGEARARSRSRGSWPSVDRSRVVEAGVESVRCMPEPRVEEVVLAVREVGGWIEVAKSWWSGLSAW